MEWKHHHLRLTAFLENAVNIRDNSWWKDTVGSDPDSTKITGSQLRVEQGTKNDLILFLKVEPLRVDWILQARDPQDFKELPNLGNKSIALKTLKEITNAWFKSSGVEDIKRIAYGTRLYSIVKDSIEGFNELAELLPSVKIDPNTSTDFLYQINRSLKSTIVDGLLINRLTKWHVSNIKTVSLDTNVSLNKTIAPDVFATTLDLDINTDAEFKGSLPRDTLDNLFEEFIKLGEDIVSKGDFQ